jgi:hypothetical protein
MRIGSEPARSFLRASSATDQAITPRPLLARPHIDNVYAKLKSDLRKAAVRTLAALRRLVGQHQGDCTIRVLLQTRRVSPLFQIRWKLL